jgi:hypothetical protein
MNKTVLALAIAAILRVSVHDALDAQLGACVMVTAGGPSAVPTCHEKEQPMLHLERKELDPVMGAAFDAGAFQPAYQTGKQFFEEPQPPVFPVRRSSLVTVLTQYPS